MKGPVKEGILFLIGETSIYLTTEKVLLERKQLTMQDKDSILMI